MSLMCHKFNVICLLDNENGFKYYNLLILSDRQVVQRTLCGVVVFLVFDYYYQRLKFLIFSCSWEQALGLCVFDM